MCGITFKAKNVLPEIYIAKMGMELSKFIFSLKRKIAYQTISLCLVWWKAESADEIMSEVKNFDPCGLPGFDPQYCIWHTEPYQK